MDFLKLTSMTLKKEFLFQIDIGNLVRYNDGIKDPIGTINNRNNGIP